MSHFSKSFHISWSTFHFSEIASQLRRTHSSGCSIGMDTFGPGLLSTVGEYSMLKCAKAELDVIAEFST